MYRQAAVAAVIAMTMATPALARHHNRETGTKFNFTTDGRIVAAHPITDVHVKYKRKRGKIRSKYIKIARSKAGNIHSASGASAYVAPASAYKFQCIVNWLDARDYKIQFMGGYRAHGSVRQSKHPLALALDINQTGRNRVTRAFPAGVNQAAEGCGLLHGAVWAWKDQGHFEVPGQYAMLTRRTRRTRLAQN